MKKLLLVLFAMVFSTGIALADDVTFDWSGETTTQSGLTSDNIFTSTPITLTFSKASGSNVPAINKEGSIRMYKGTTLTIKADDGYQITGVVFTPTTSSYSASNLTYNDVAISDSWTLTTPAQEVLLSATANARFKTMIVSYTAAGGVVKKSADLAFSETKIDIENGVDAFTAPTFTKATTAAVTFASDNESVATVNANGVISLAGGLGTAVITATAVANDEYNEGTASCTINVFKYNVYKKVTEITSGKEYLIVAQRNDSTVYAYPLAETYTYGYLSVGTIKELTDEIKVKSLYDDGFTFTAVDGGYTIQDCYDRYLYQKDEYKSFNVSADNAAVWTVEPQGDGTFKIAINGYFIQWGQGTHKTWGVYTEQQANAVLPMLYQLDESSSNINAVATVKTVNENAPVYNLAGQRVGKNAKGILIQNGRKFIRK